MATKIHFSVIRLRNVAEWKYKGAGNGNIQVTQGYKYLVNVLCSFGERNSDFNSYDVNKVIIQTRNIHFHN